MKSSSIEFQLLKTTESFGFCDTSKVATKIFMMFENISTFQAFILMTYNICLVGTSYIGMIQYNNLKYRWFGILKY